MDENQARIKLERAIVRALIRQLKKAGWKPLFVDDGGETPVPATTEKAAMDAVFAVDDSRLYFSNGNIRHSVLLIGGNGEDIVSDWSFQRGDSDGFNKAMDAFLDFLTNAEARRIDAARVSETRYVVAYSFRGKTSYLYAPRAGSYGWTSDRSQATEHVSKYAARIAAECCGKDTARVETTAGALVLS
jgi:hypothetical protein